MELQGTNNSGNLSPSIRPNGWTIGAGVEHAMIANWNLRLDYRYSDLSGDFNFTSEMSTPHSFDLNMKSHDIQIGAVYRF